MALTESEKSLLARVPTGLFIDGKWRDSSDGRTLEVEDPSTGETLAWVADASVADGAAALDAAVAAQAGWAATAPRERGEILRRAFTAITARAEEFALLMTLEMGKPLVHGPEWGHPPDDHEAAGRSHADDHAVELPAGDGHAQDRPCLGGRLHHGGQAGQTDAAVDAGPGGSAHRLRCACRCRQRHHHDPHR